MSNLVVIGNGFDIAHGLNTRYSDFIKYLLTFEKIPEIVAPGYFNRYSISDADQVKLELYEKLKKYIPEKDLWNSLEEALGKLDYDELQEDSSVYYIDYGDEDWKDSANHDYQFMIEEGLNFTYEMNNQFVNWINTIDTKVKSIENILDIMETNNIYLNFNYTDTLEKVYSISENNINYIHGKASRRDKLVLGHHDSSYWTREDILNMSDDEYEAYCEYQSERDFRVIEAEKVMQDYFKRTYKDTKKIIDTNRDFFNSLKDVKNIFILGHSLSEIDFNYFEEISNYSSKNSKWIFSYYSEEDKLNANALIERLDIQNFAFMKIV